MVDNATGTIVKSANLPFEGFPIREKMSERFGIPIHLEEDANAAALAEYFAQEISPREVFCYVTISTGIGMGVVQDGKVLNGARGGMGEIGHMIVDAGSGAVCTCGRVGCLEALASGRALQLQSEALEHPGRQSSQGNENSPLVVELAEQGDANAATIVERATRYIGGALDTVSQVLDPEMLIVGGGVMKSDLIFEMIQQHYYKLRHGTYHGPKSLTRSKLGRWGPVVGMAHLLKPYRMLEGLPDGVTLGIKSMETGT